MRRLLWGGWLILCCVMAAPCAHATTLRLVADPWPPFTDENLPDNGLATAIVSQALTRAGYSVSFEQVPWARALQGIETGRYDVLVNAWYTEARAAAGAFSQPYLINRIRLLRAPNARVSFDGQLPSLIGHSIAVVRDYTYSPDFDNDSALTKVPVHSFSQGLRMLLAGRVDLTVEDEYVARYYLRQEQAPQRDQVSFTGPPLAQNPLHILVSRKNPDYQHVVQGFDQAVAQMKADGTLQSLISHYGL